MVFLLRKKTLTMKSGLIAAKGASSRGPAWTRQEVADKPFLFKKRKALREKKKQEALMEKKLNKHL